MYLPFSSGMAYAHIRWAKCYICNRILHADLKSAWVRDIIIKHNTFKYTDIIRAYPNLLRNAHAIRRLKGKDIRTSYSVFILY